MLPYTFYLHDGPTTTPALVLESFYQQANALAYARKLLADRPHYNTVEVRQSDVLIARVQRDEAPA